nr:GAF domain-containing protein [Pontibacillus yanchengensis]
MVRHHESASRLISSLTYSFHSGRYSLDNVLRETLAECITVLEKDQSDKSISLFEVKDDILQIRDGIRISAESVVKRTFEKGTGFAGSVWEKGEAEYINNIDYEGDPRFNHEEHYFPKRNRFKSMMGIPLQVDEQIIGVLCIQSESEDGFCADDLRALEFYANLCTFMMLYDKIGLNTKGSEDNDSSK